MSHDLNQISTNQKKFKVKKGAIMSGLIDSETNVQNFYFSNFRFGIRHVVLLIVLALVIYAWLITKHNFNQEQVDKKIRQNLPWLILLCFAVEGIFGMPIAIYIDVSNYVRH